MTEAAVMIGLVCFVQHVRPDDSIKQSVVVLFWGVAEGWAPVGRVQQNGINLSLLLHIRFEVSVHQATRDTASQLLSFQLARILSSHLPCIPFSRLQACCQTRLASNLLTKSLIGMKRLDHAAHHL